MTVSWEPSPDPRAVLTADAAAARMGALHPDWRLDGAALTRRFTFRNFAKAMQMANLAGWLGEAQGHHPDLAFGWGWCAVTFTSHDAGGITATDFLCAGKLDAITAQVSS